MRVSARRDFIALKNTRGSIQLGLKMKTIIRSVAAMVVASALGAGAAQAAQIVLAPSNVVGVYGNFDGFSTGGRIFDKQTGVINEAFGTDYWINSDNSPADAFLTVDLLTAYDPGTFELFNTNNGGVGDRGTANFSIVGGNAVSAFAGGLRLTGPEILLVNGTLDRVFGNIRTSQTFASAVSGGVRYLEFRPVRRQVH